MDYIDYKYASEELKKEAQDVVFEAIEKNASDLNMHPDDYLIELGLVKAAEYMDKLAIGPALKNPKRSKKWSPEILPKPTKAQMKTKAAKTLAKKVNPIVKKHRAVNTAATEKYNQSEVLRKALRDKSINDSYESLRDTAIARNKKMDAKKQYWTDKKNMIRGKYEGALRGLGNLGKGDSADNSQAGIIAARQRGKVRAGIGLTGLGLAGAGAYAYKRNQDEDERKSKHASDNSYANELVERAKQQLYANQ